MRFALINSGLGLLAAAAELRRQSPGVELILAMDPDGMPWGARTPDDIAQRSLACARAAAEYGPDVLVFACNTGSVHALDALRQRFEPGIPVVGTVPAIKPAAAAGQPIAIWATAATTGSSYQRALIARFAASVPVTEVACPGLADAINAGDEAAIAAAAAAAAARTPGHVHAVVLGCTEYELASQAIAAALPGVSLHGSASAVAAQALRRASGSAAPNGRQPQPGPGGHPQPGRDAHPQPGRDAHPQPGRDAHLQPARDADPQPAYDGQPQPGPGGQLEPGRAAEPESAHHAQPEPAHDGQPQPGTAGVALRVLLSGRPGDLPPAAFRYREGRFLSAGSAAVSA
jgi:glutamate racemase